ncbi:MAG: hypothetical protein LBG94_01640 [Treponema sp.]|jgi:hypothetical protein|nr:hypothetical protein [Treponema sp.]
MRNLLFVLLAFLAIFTYIRAMDDSEEADHTIPVEARSDIIPIKSVEIFR